MKVIITEQQSEDIKEKLYKMKKMACEIMEFFEDDMEEGARRHRRYEEDDREERGFRMRGRY